MFQFYLHYLRGFSATVRELGLLTVE